MARYIKIMAIAVTILGVVAIVLGGVFVGLGMDKANFLKEEMRGEKVTYLLPEDEIAKGNVVDTSKEAENVANQIRDHRRGIAPTYDELLGDGRYDPTNPEHLSYNQALNMENYLYLAVMGFGVTQAIIGTGVFMLVIGFAVTAAGIALFMISRRISMGTAGLKQASI
ncbi:MAG: hypothetical protein HOC20_13010 [Chloroflexi bacterium]|nr:hypothetical protein [Chloroflexota bacterium]